MTWRNRVVLVVGVILVAACSGGADDIDTAAPAGTATPVPSPTATAAPTPTALPTATPTPTPTPLPTATPVPTPVPVAVPCVEGSALGYPCDNVGLEALLTIADLGGGPADQISDLWGWTDPTTGDEIVIVLGTFGTAFVDVTDPAESFVRGILPLPDSVTELVLQRDVKVYRDHAYIVSESPGHGLQILDLTHLRFIGGDEPAGLQQSGRYADVDTAHNIAINEETGFAYLVGSDQCEGGPVMLDLASATEPVPVGCFADHGYTHDIQCVIYRGPAETFHGRELCFAANEDAIGITDMTDKAAPVALATATYDGVGYTHQGWLTEDQRHFVVDDEADEGLFGHPTRTRIFDVSDPTAPTFVGSYDAGVTAADHNLYIVDDLLYMANYRSGLRIVRLVDPAAAELVEVGFFDTVPSDDTPDYLGAFSVYPFFVSDTVLVTSRNEGLFVLRPDVAGGAG